MMKTTASFKAFDGIIWTQDPNTGEREESRDIFDSTRYAKKLEAIKTSCKEYVGTVNNLKAYLEGLKSRKHACKNKISEFDDEIQRCNEGMDKEQARASKAMQELNQIARFQSEMDAKQQEMDKEEAVLDSQREMLRKLIRSMNSRL
eukprot:scaffold18327_cov44-Cyclotella_meneghiniana.AAC.1